MTLIMFTDFNRTWWLFWTVTFCMSVSRILKRDCIAAKLVPLGYAVCAQGWHTWSVIADNKFYWRATDAKEALSTIL